MGEQLDQSSCAGERALDPLRADDRGGRRHDRIGRIAGLPRRLGSSERRIADEVHLGGDRDVEHGAVVLARDLVHQRQREIGLERQQCEVEHGVAVHARHLRLGSMTVAPDLSFMFWRGITAPICSVERFDLRDRRAALP